jgi:antitoxin MazE
MIKKEVELKAWGNSQGIRFTKDDLNALHIEGSIVFEMTIEDGEIRLVPKKKEVTTLEELFADYEGEPLGEMDHFDWGNPVGRELW